MEKIINTTKYMKYIKTFVLVVLLVAISPLVASAQESTSYPDYSYDTVSYPDYSYDTVSYPDYSYDTVSYPDYSYDTVSYPDYSYDTVSYPDYSYDTNYDRGYSLRYVYTPSYDQPYYYPTRSNWVGVGSSVTVIPGVSQPNYVYPTTPNYVQASFTGTSPVYTQPTYVQSYVPPVQNQVLAYTDTNPSLDSVYLSDVPYTGLSDYYGLIAFISLIISWSAIIAYVFLKRKIAEKNMFASAYVTTMKSEETDGSIISNFINQVASDKSDIREVEEYARMKKVLLSTDAATKLVKIQRLGEGSAKNIIDQFSVSDWVAVGEKDLDFVK